MHIPDGYVDLPIAAVFAVLAGLALAVAARRSEGRLEGGQAPLVGVTAAGIFAAQMLNWPLPIPGGTSAHFVGGAFAGILLGPHLGVLAMSSVVVVQALVFGDGGLTVLGANLFNMAVVEVYVGYAIFRLGRRWHDVGAAFAAGWIAATAGAFGVAVQLGVSSAFNYELLTVLAIMGGGHALLGVIEGAITAVVYQAVVRSRPDVLPSATREVAA